MLDLEIIASLLGLLAVILMLVAAVYIQIVYQEEPCPLCLLQRAALINMGIALFINLRHRSDLYWSLVILSAAAGAAVSIRQILLHVTDKVGYGSAVFGLHMYTWCFIAFAAAIVGGSTVILCKNWNSTTNPSVIS